MTAPGATAGLLRLARLYGIQHTYYSNRRRIAAGPDAIIAVLRAMGVDVRSAEDAAKATRERLAALHSRAVEPVHVLWDGLPGSIPVNQNGQVECSLHLESGERREWRAPPASHISLPALPPGYHTLSLKIGRRRQECLVISAPSRAYQPPGESRHWGLFLPAYAARRKGDWGAGDFTSLGCLADLVGRMGGSFLGTTPLMAAFLDRPFDPSPYAPASRLFWNELYLDIERIPDLAACEEARLLVNSPEFRRRLSGSPSDSLIDYRRVMALKRRVIQVLAASLAGARLSHFRRFLRDRPDVTDYAHFRAAGELNRGAWPEWPDPGRSGRLAKAELDPGVVGYHEYAQWVSEEQMAALAAGSAQSGVSLYFDLPLGAARDSYDVWKLRDLFALGASTGAPPDAFFTQGQDWGFPPVHPERVRDGRYEHFIAVVRRALRFAGALRIDHVMGLHRLFWVPPGMSAAEGLYVHYRSEEAYAILCLESHRHRTAIIGEDLGTVPPAVKTSLGRHNIVGMHVLQYAVSDRPPAVRQPPARAVASLNTHDTPTFAAWLEGGDVEDSLRLGFIDRVAAVDSHLARCRQRKVLTRFLTRRGLVPQKPSALDLLRGSLRHMARSRAKMVLVNLEDLWLETRRHNIPGTGEDRHPNWRGRMARPIEEVEADPEVTATLRAVNADRSRGRSA